MTKYFDSLTHPTISGDWFKNEDSSFSTLLKYIENNEKIFKLCAVNNPVFGCSNKVFFRECKFSEKLYPVARISGERDFLKDMADATKIGFEAIKIHPRQLKITNLADFDNLFQVCEAENIKVFFCSYYYTNDGCYPEFDYLFQLSQTMNKFPNLKLLLLHGGGVRLLEFMEFVRHHPTVLLDLSLTMLKYQGSSVEMDIKFVLNQFDRRVCIGSDHPEYSVLAPLEYVSNLCPSLNKSKFDNITWLNLAKFLEVNA